MSFVTDMKEGVCMLLWTMATSAKGKGSSNPFNPNVILMGFVLFSKSHTH